MHKEPPSTCSRQLSENALAVAIGNHEAGNLQQAEDIYRKILEKNPNNPDVLNLMGILANQRKRSDEAENFIRKAISKNGLVPSYHNNLGIVLQSLNKLDNAIQCYQKALNLEPDFTEAHINLGITLQTQGKVDDAIKHYQKALHLKPGIAKIHFNMGVALYDQGEFDAAIESYKKAIQLEPDVAEGYNNLGLVFRDQGKLDDAIEYYGKAIHIKPDYAEAHGNLGTALRDQGILGKAEECYRQAIHLKPDCAEIHGNLGTILRDQGRLGEAIECYQNALHLNPNYPEAHNNLGGTLRDQGKIDKAIECFQKELQLRPDLSFVHSNLLLTLHYNDTIDPIQLFSYHQQWAEQHASPVSKTPQSHINDKSPNRRLRIGYVSPDFRMHSVAYFIEPIISSHNPDTFEIICYSNVISPDSVTHRLKGLASCWRNIVGMSEERVADLIRNDQIDFLVDLAGHTAQNRMLLFAKKPAPVQVAYLGYPNTTGLGTMDYRITDNLADPTGQTDHLHAEELTRLPQSFLCYQPPEESPEVSKSPARNTGYVTFGSFNDRAKVTPEAVRIWSAILKSVSNSRLILKSKALNDIGTRQTLWEMFSKNGVVSERIELVGYLPFEQHLKLYNRIDIGLDTFPYNGTTTTCEAMWMGVPVITLAGDFHASRVGASLLSNVGMPELVSASAEDYIEKAAKLANNLDRLQDLRINLRPLMARSPLMDATDFTRALEAAYRQMWHRWCDQNQNSLSENEDTPPISSISNHEITITNQNDMVNKDRKLHIGGNIPHSDWEIFNAIPGTYVDHVGNAKDLSCFSDETFAKIYASHVLEHFDYVDELSTVLKEWHRVLRFGGKLYASVPDMDKLADLFLMKDKLSLEERFHVMRMIFGGHTDKYDYHKVGLNQEFLESLLINAGFSNLKVVDDFGIFNDTSTMRFHGIPISVNIETQKVVIAPKKQSNSNSAKAT